MPAFGIKRGELVLEVEAGKGYAALKDTGGTVPLKTLKATLVGDKLIALAATAK